MIFSSLCVSQSAQLVKHLRKVCFHILIRELAGSDLLMSTAVILKHKMADIYLAGLVDNAVSYSSRTALATLAVNDPCRNILLRIHTVDKETVACIYGIHLPEIAYDNVTFNTRISCNHFLELGCLLLIDLDPFLNIRHIEDLLCRLILAGTISFSIS